MIYNADDDTVTIPRREYNLLEDRILKMQTSLKSILEKQGHAKGNYFFEWVVDAAFVALQVDNELKQLGE